jgi:CheY-like chemotaxis protein
MMHNKLDALIRSNLDNLNILVVDDVSSIRKTTKKLLEKSGFNVVISENGAEAVKKMNEGQFDVVLMDLQMPVMDGIEAMKAIRKKERQQYQMQEQQLASVSTLSPTSSIHSVGSPNDVSNGATNTVGDEAGTKNDFNSASFNAALTGPKKQTFIIALSAFSDEVTLAETYQAGADAFIAKPFNLGQFKETLQSLMTMTN